MDLLKVSATLSAWYFVTRYLFPDKVNSVTTKLLYKTFAFYSRCKFYLNKISNNIDKKKLYFIKDGRKIFELTITTFEEIRDISQRINDHVYYDFLFYVNRNNYVRYNNLEEFLKNNLVYNSNFVNFINVNLTYNENEYELDLKTDNYYIENNILFDQVFMQYYLLKYYNIIYDDKLDYKIHILDNTFNTIEITNKQYLIIQEPILIMEQEQEQEQEKEKEQEKEQEQLSNDEDCENLDLCEDNIPTHKLQKNTGWFSFLYFPI